MDVFAEAQKASESTYRGRDERSSRYARSSKYEEDDHKSSSRHRSRSRDRSDRYDDERSSRRSRRDEHDRDYRSSRRYDDEDRGSRRTDDRRERERSSRYDYDDRRSSRRDDGGRRDYDDRRYARPADRDFRGRGGGGPPGGGARSAAYESGPFGSGRRSATPEGTIPISRRKRPRTGWDVKPAGMETVTALQAKMSGRFNLPGQNRPHLPPASGGGGGGYSGMNGPPTFGSLEDNFPPGITYARQARRLYVGGITPAATEQNVTEFFNSKMRETGNAKDQGTDVQSADPIISVQVNHEKSYAFVEFRTADEASASMSFDGVMFQGQQLKIRRPKDYLGNDMMGAGGGPNGQIPDSPNKIFIGGLPSYLTEEQVRELLTSFGELKHFNLVKEYTGNSKGFAFAEYADPSLTDVACEGLNGMELGDRYLVVQRASVGQGGKSNAGGGRGPHGNVTADAQRFAPGIMAGSSAEGDPTRVLQMLNMVTPEELVDDQDYEDIVEDTKEECGKFGEVIEIRIPRPARTDKGKMDVKASEEVPNLGKVFVMFDSIDSAKRAMASIAGRQFAGRVVVVAFADEATMIS